MADASSSRRATRSSMSATVQATPCYVQDMSFSSAESDNNEEEVVKNQASTSTSTLRSSTRLRSKIVEYSHQEDDEDTSSDEYGSSDCSEDEESDDEEENIVKKQPALLPSFASSPGPYAFTSKYVDSYNHESYLLANTRLKFKSVPNRRDLLGVANDSRKGRAKKPRKGTRGLGGRGRVDNLPERDLSNFSVSKATLTALENCPVLVHNLKHDAEIEAHLVNKIIPDFPRWMSFMWEGFNIILHGFGSKLSVVDAFREQLKDNFIVFEINGLFPKLNSRKILMDFVGTLKTKITIKGNSADVITEDVCKQLPHSHSPIFMIVQNFDTLASGNPNVLTVICSLAEIPWVHLLATTDNVNASLGVTQSQSVQLNFCWIPCSTFQPYIEEFNWTPHIFGESNGSKAAENTLQYVLKSLTGNARKAFSILTSLQLNKLQGFNNNTRGGGNKKGNNKVEFVGVEFSELAQKCKDNFVAHNDTVLRTLLVEFVDHKLVTNHQGKRKGGGNFLTVDLDIEILQKIVKDGI